MMSILQPEWRRFLRQAVCLFCLLRPLWGWLDRKAESEAAPDPATPAAQNAPVRSYGLGDVIATPKPVPPQELQGEPE